MLMEKSVDCLFRERVVTCCHYYFVSLSGGRVVAGEVRQRSQDTNSASSLQSQRAKHHHSRIVGAGRGASHALQSLCQELTGYRMVIGDKVLKATEGPPSRASAGWSERRHF